MVIINEDVVVLAIGIEAKGLHYKIFLTTVKVYITQVTKDIFYEGNMEGKIICQFPSLTFRDKIYLNSEG